jgi:hypothetical protein
VRIGFRAPSLKKRIAARTSWKRIVRHRLGAKAPAGGGWLTDPARAARNRIYQRTTLDPLHRGAWGGLVLLAILVACVLAVLRH